MNEKHLKSDAVHSRALIVAVALLILSAALCTLLLPGPELLYRENRKAAAKPFLSRETLWDAS